MTNELGQVGSIVQVNPIFRNYRIRYIALNIQCKNTITRTLVLAFIFRFVLQSVVRM